MLAVRGIKSTNMANCIVLPYYADDESFKNSCPKSGLFFVSVYFILGAVDSIPQKFPSIIRPPWWGHYPKV